MRAQDVRTLSLTHKPFFGFPLVTGPNRRKQFDFVNLVLVALCTKGAAYQLNLPYLPLGPALLIDRVYLKADI